MSKSHKSTPAQDATQHLLCFTGVKAPLKHSYTPERRVPLLGTNSRLQVRLAHGMYFAVTFCVLFMQISLGRDELGSIRLCLKMWKRCSKAKLCTSCICWRNPFRRSSEGEKELTSVSHSLPPKRFQFRFCLFPPQSVRNRKCRLVPSRTKPPRSHVLCRPSTLLYKVLCKVKLE